MRSVLGEVRDHFVVDGNNLLHRAAYSARRRDSSPDPVYDDRACLLFLNSLRSILYQFSPRRVTVVWDGERAARRVALLSEYKETSLRTQRSKASASAALSCRTKLSSVLKRLSVRVSFLPNREADDLVWWLAQRSPTIVVSDDMDFYQLLPLRAAVYHPGKKELVTETTFFGKFGFSPEQYLLYKCLVGDQSDNVDGVPKVGEETAKAIVQSSPSIVTVDDALARVSTFPISEARRLAVSGGASILRRNWDVLRLGDTFTQAEVAALTASQELTVTLDPTVTFDLTNLGLEWTQGVSTWVDPFRILR